MSRLLKQISLTKLAFLAIVLILGINFIFVRISNRELPPFWGASLRFLIASIGLFTLMQIKNIQLPSGKDLKYSILYGVLSFGANSGLLYWGLKSASPATASIIYATIPLTTLLIATYTKTDRLTPKRLASVISVIAGIAIIFYQQILTNSSLSSLSALIAASICAAVSGIVVKQVKEANPISTNMVGMTSGGLLLLGLSLIAGETITLPSLSLTWISLIWLVISSTFAFILMVWTINKTGPTNISYTSVLSPIITIAANSLLTHEIVTTSYLIGSVIVLMGVVFGLRNNNYSQNDF